ncbi:MAG: HDOD domain-containing protein [Desulfosarcinaceae bacterium]|nr:HDOD domain-containing protein [Desulfosarcinaceae bacterium]
MDAYVARQPIFSRNKTIYAYELLFRDGTANFVPDIDGDIATATVMSNSVLTIGIESILGDKRAFINFTQNLLVNKAPLLLPKETTVVEILEDVTPEADLLAACAEMATQGYLLALDDFEFSPELMPLIEMAHIIKFDFRLTPLDEIAAYLKQLPDGKRRLLAEKVETHAEFETAKEMGFELFQGYFFCKPEIIKGREIPGSQLNLIQLMSALNQKDFQFDQLENLVAQDVGLSYKLMRYINSPFFGRANKVASVKQGLVFLGEKEIRRFISLVAMSRLAADKPNELVRTSCIRGKFCELICEHNSSQWDAPELFTLGMFSLIDAIVDSTMQDVMDRMPLSPNLKDALIEAKGPLSPYLALICAYERGEWQRVSKLATALKVDEERLPDLYRQACIWSNSVIDS